MNLYPYIYEYIYIYPGDPGGEHAQMSYINSYIYIYIYIQVILGENMVLNDVLSVLLIIAGDGRRFWPALLWSKNLTTALLRSKRFDRRWSKWFDQRWFLTGRGARTGSTNFLFFCPCRFQKTIWPAGQNQLDRLWPGPNDWTPARLAGSCWPQRRSKRFDRWSNRFWPAVKTVEAPAATVRSFDHSAGQNGSTGAGQIGQVALTRAKANRFYGAGQADLTRALRRQWSNRLTRADPGQHWSN